MQYIPYRNSKLTRVLQDRNPHGAGALRSVGSESERTTGVCEKTLLRRRRTLEKTSFRSTNSGGG